MDASAKNKPSAQRDNSLTGKHASASAEPGAAPKVKASTLSAASAKNVSSRAAQQGSSGILQVVSADAKN